MRQLPLLSWGTVVLTVAVGLAFFFLTSNYAHNRNVESQRFEQVRSALCQIRAETHQRILSTESFLRTHPQGFAGLSAATIRNGLVGPRTTYEALTKLNCRG